MSDEANNADATPENPIPPPTSDAIAPGAPTEESAAAPAPSSDLPPPPDPAAIASLGRKFRVLEGAMLVVLAVLSFFLAAFVIVNSDFWLHLATGRYLSESLDNLGVDPFCFTTQDVRWVNHSWLYDVVVYQLHELIGPEGLVVLKALLFVGLLGLLLRLRLEGGFLWLPIVCLTLAALASSERLIFQPLLLSLVLLGLLLVLLLDRSIETRRLWLIPALVALWVNLDGWFVLGPLLVALVWLGEATLTVTAETAAAMRARRQTLLRVLGVSVLACLLNPHGVYALTPPLEVGHLLGKLGLPIALLGDGGALHAIETHDPSFTATLAQWGSPLSTSFLWRSQQGMNVPSAAYTLLLLLGLLSWPLLLLRRVPWQGTRLLLWLLFTGLSLYSARLIPLFAVAAAPLTALNWQEYFRATIGAEPRTQRPWRGLALVGRFGTVVVLLTLAALAWPGWLHSKLPDGRHLHRVALGAVVEPTYAQAAQQMRAWHAAGQLGHGFNLYLDVAAYTAWYAPDVKNFYDHRFALFAHLAVDIGQLRSAVRRQTVVLRGTSLNEQQRQREAEQLLRRQQQLFEKHQITHLLLTHFDGDQVSKLLLYLCLYRPADWTLIYGNGRISALAWRPTPGASALTFDPRPLVFGSQAVKLTEAAAGQRFSADALTPPKLLTTWESYTSGDPLWPVHARTSMHYIDQYMATATLAEGEWQKQYAEQRGQLMPTSMAAVLTTMPVLIPGQAIGFIAPLGAWAALESLDGMLLAKKPKYAGDPALPLLSLQLGQRAIRESPNHSKGYEAVARSLDLLKRTQEDRWLFPNHLAESLRTNLRRVQWLARLHDVTMADTTSYEFPLQLSTEFYNLQLYDASYAYLRLALGRMMESYEQSGGNPELKREITKHERISNEMEKMLKERQDYFDLNSPNEQLVKRFQMALYDRHKSDANVAPLGLALAALQVLRNTDISKLSEDLLRFHLREYLRLRLLLGHAREVAREIEQLDVQKVDLAGRLGPIYWQMKAEAAAALGDYPLAEHCYGEMETGLEQLRAAEMRNSQVLTALNGFILDTRTPWQAVLQASFISGQATAITERANTLQLHNKALCRTMRGLMALENGDPVRARALFQEAAAQKLPPEGELLERPLLRNYLELLDKAAAK